MDYDRVREIAAGILMALVIGGAIYGIYRVVKAILIASGYYDSSW